MTEAVARRHLGAGRLALQREHSVFINCPFDAEFAPLFDALVFATICCGFMPRSALEASSAEPRITRIRNAMSGSKYSIHDLSRCKGEGALNLARFNMPLELGMAIAFSGSGQDSSESHDWFLLVPSGHIYQQLVSDLAGFDPGAHDGTVPAIVSATMSWLATRPDAVATPTPRSVLDALPDFEAGVAKLRSQWGENPPWVDLIQMAIGVAEKHHLVPSA